ncbi:hypothetical protein IU418_26635 [Nocardia farcinica]|nr:hypothetical protein [Nocardia farcinica]MBF6540789.1 hypothetical protein [Nocardia farcinica]
MPTPNHNPRPPQASALRRITDHAKITACILGLTALWTLILLALDWTNTPWIGL